MTRSDRLITPEMIWKDPPVLMFTAPNPGPKTLEGTHTYVVGTSDCYLIDPGPANRNYGEALAGWLRAHGCRVGSILLTHGHPDHAQGALFLSDLLGTPIRAPANLDRSYLTDRLDTIPLVDGEALPVDGDLLRVFATPGHSADHVAFFLSAARILFSGDTILGRGTSVIAPPEGSMTDYMNTLARLQLLHARLIAPGHGPLIDDPARKIEEYRLHRLEREEQILQALSRTPRTVDDLVVEVYTAIDPSLRVLAAASVQAHLEKLLGEGRAGCLDGRYYLPT